MGWQCCGCVLLCTFPCQADTDGLGAYAKVAAGGLGQIRKQGADTDGFGAQGKAGPGTEVAGVPT